MIRNESGKKIMQKWAGRMGVALSKITSDDIDMKNKICRRRILEDHLTNLKASGCSPIMDTLIGGDDDGCW